MNPNSKRAKDLAKRFPQIKSAKIKVTIKESDKEEQNMNNQNQNPEAQVELVQPQVDQTETTQQSTGWERPEQPGAEARESDTFDVEVEMSSEIEGQGLVSKYWKHATAVITGTTGGAVVNHLTDSGKLSGIVGGLLSGGAVAYMKRDDSSIKSLGMIAGSSFVASVGTGQAMKHLFTGTPIKTEYDEVISETLEAIPVNEDLTSAVAEWC